MRRHGNQLIGRHEAGLRHAAVEHFAHQSLLLVERIDEHAVPELPVRYAASHLGNFARHVEPDHHRQRHLDARHAVADDVVEEERLIGLIDQRRDVADVDRLP